MTRVNALHLDGLGSVRAVTDGTGTVVERTSFRPYGEEVAGVPGALGLSETKGFIGERYDDASGLQYLNARYYDPRLGMFLQPDWWEVMQAGVGTNRYGYAGGDPVNGRDPEGHSWLDDLGRSIRDSFGALGDALSGNVHHIDNAGQPGTNGAYGVIHAREATYGCFGCSGTGAAAEAALDAADDFAYEKAHDVAAQFAFGQGISGYGAIPLPLAYPEQLEESLADLLPKGQRVYVTYILRDRQFLDRYYYGRTSGYADPETLARARYASHWRSGSYDFLKVDNGMMGPDAYCAIRGREQQLIDTGGGVGSFQVGNVIRGVSRFNYVGHHWWELSNHHFGNIAPFTGYLN